MKEEATSIDPAFSRKAPYPVSLLKSRPPPVEWGHHTDAEDLLNMSSGTVNAVSPAADDRTVMAAPEMDCSAPVANLDPDNNTAIASTIKPDPDAEPQVSTQGMSIAQDISTQISFKEEPDLGYVDNAEREKTCMEFDLPDGRIKITVNSEQEAKNTNCEDFQNNVNCEHDEEMDDAQRDTDVMAETLEHADTNREDVDMELMNSEQDETVNNIKQENIDMSLHEKDFDFKENVMSVVDGDDTESTMNSAEEKTTATELNSSKNLTLNINNYKRNLECTICGVTIGRYSLKRHMLTHSEEMRFSCSICNKAFQRKDTMKLHERLHDENAYQCKICQEKFLSEDHLQQHSVSDATCYFFKCAECGDIFKEQDQLRIHRHMHTDKPFACKKCDESFGDVDQLLIHSEKHYGKKVCMCKTCGKFFSTSDQLRKHVMMCSMKKTLKCDMCDADCADTVQLKQHRSLHDRMKPNVCSVCGRAFSLLTNLHTHFKTHMKHVIKVNTKTTGKKTKPPKKAPGSSHDRICVKTPQTVKQSMAVKQHAGLPVVWTLPANVRNQVAMMSNGQKLMAVPDSGAQPQTSTAKTQDGPVTSDALAAAPAGGTVTSLNATMLQHNPASSNALVVVTVPNISENTQPVIPRNTSDGSSFPSVLKVVPTVHKDPASTTQTEGMGKSDGRDDMVLDKSVTGEVGASSDSTYARNNRSEINASEFKAGLTNKGSLLIPKSSNKHVLGETGTDKIGTFSSSVSSSPSNMQSSLNVPLSSSSAQFSLSSGQFSSSSLLSSVPSSSGNRVSLLRPDIMKQLKNNAKSSSRLLSSSFPLKVSSSLNAQISSSSIPSPSSSAPSPSPSISSSSFAVPPSLSNSNKATLSAGQPSSLLTDLITTCGQEFCTTCCTLGKHDHNQKPKVKEKSIKCSDCDLKFWNNYSLKKHCLVHTGDKPYICEICGKGFRSGTYHKMHLRLHSGEKPYQCEVCGKSFAIRANLMKHSRIHTGEKPFQCKFCEQKFTVPKDLKRHTWKKHASQMPFGCDSCEERFATAHDLAEHAKVPHGKQLYGCKLCGKTFIKQRSLRLHESRMHS